MAKFNVRTVIINIFYTSTIDGVMQCCLAAWCGNASKADIKCIDSIIRKASKAIKISQPNIDSIYKGLLSIKLNMMWTDTKHSLHVYLHYSII